ERRERQAERHLGFFRSQMRESRGRGVRAGRRPFQQLVQIVQRLIRGRACHFVCVCFSRKSVSNAASSIGLPIPPPHIRRCHLSDSDQRRRPPVRASWWKEGRLELSKAPVVFTWDRDERNVRRPSSPRAFSSRP